MRWGMCGVVCVTAIVGFLGCGGDGIDHEAEVEANLEQAREHRPYEVHWLGPEYEGEPLDDAHPNGFWVFFYGDCEDNSDAIFEIADDSGCSHAVTVDNEGVCSVPRTGLPRNKGGWTSRNVKGAIAVWNRFQPGITVLTGRTIVHLLADEREQEFAQAEALRPVSSDEPVARLDPPAPGSMEGELPCQRRHSD